MEIVYTNGDATEPTHEGNKIIVHVCNDIGAWGKGFVLAISKKWKEPAIQYKNWYKSQKGFVLGNVQFVKVENTIWIANLIGQHKIYKDENGIPPIRYDAIEVGLQKTAEFALENNASVHMPRIGCGLAGGTWNRMEPLIQKSLSNRGVPVTVYDL